jgi:hypothetical protein
MTEEERVELAVVKRDVKSVCEDVAELKGDVRSMSGKLDAALATKADVAYVEAVDRRVADVNKRIWLILVASAGFAITSLVGIFAYVVYQFIARGIGS